ncbi:hypothetical protein GOP47_0023747 [Adiantum capillus-veneris]|uniref:Uncharacterized protein n=1 Tax=Adiantum capillus-veneris TaxID=13818 RepID=A0A9D4U559_ADICA|nr:hypothetical protein GOP47_0023747 [Adiantum capillus-veneris]
MMCTQGRQGHSHRRGRRGIPRRNKCAANLREDELSAETKGLAATLNNSQETFSSSDKKEHPSEKAVSSKAHFIKPVNCNLDRFLDATCPSIRAHHVPKRCQRENCRKRLQAGNVESLPYFILGDLWDCFDEWSAYGAGVPITLKGHGKVMQYYVPYLSALQLYTRSMKRQNTKCRDPPDSIPDCCSVGSLDTRDEDSNNMPVPDCDHCLCGVFEESVGTCCGCGKLDKSNKVDFHCDLDDESCSISSASFHDGDWHRNLRFEYFESSPPYARVPVSEKIAQLAASFPELKTLRSVDLLPASWMSIAWYPIYRIPTGPTLQDLEACFLTFHSLSTSLEDGEPSGIVKRSNRPTACAVPSSSAEMMQWEYPTIYLEAFGLAHYKLRGSIWTSVGNPERRHAASLYRCAQSWLEQLHVGHPDFNFFRSHNPPSSVT